MRKYQVFKKKKKESDIIYFFLKLAEVSFKGVVGFFTNFKPGYSNWLLT